MLTVVFFKSMLPQLRLWRPSTMCFLAVWVFIVSTAVWKRDIHFSIQHLSYSFALDFSMERVQPGSCWYRPKMGLPLVAQWSKNVLHCRPDPDPEAPLRRAWQSHSVFLPESPHGQRSSSSQAHSGSHRIRHTTEGSRKAAQPSCFLLCVSFPHLLSPLWCLCPDPRTHTHCPDLFWILSLLATKMTNCTAC